MKNRAAQYARPAMWGFFICMVLAGILAVVHYYIPSFIETRWESERNSWRSQADQLIREVFSRYLISSIN
jgi:hypothetical protein